jgi:hypothetical protein
VHLAAGLETVDSGNHEVERRCDDATQRRIDILGLGAADLADESHGQMHVFRIDPFRARKPGTKSGEAKPYVFRKRDSNE